MDIPTLLLEWRWLTMTYLLCNGLCSRMRMSMSMRRMTMTLMLMVYAVSTRMIQPA